MYVDTVRYGLPRATKFDMLAHAPATVFCDSVTLISTFYNNNNNVHMWAVLNVVIASRALCKVDPVLSR